MELITLSNSLRIFLNRTDTLRSATVGVWIGSGSRFENEENNGISHFIEHIVFKGSEKRTGFEIAEGMDEIGAYVNAYTTKEYTFFYTKALDYRILAASIMALKVSAASLSLDSMAYRFGYSKEYFSKKFKQNVGKNFLSYLNDVRLQKAVEFLNDPERTMTFNEICTKCGFNNSATLYRHLKKIRQANPRLK